MAVDVDKLIADAKKAQAAARTAAAKAQAQASKDKVDAETQARSKSQTDYANTLKPRLEQYESELGIWARKIARGDKLSAVEQNEFDRLVKEYNSVNKAVDAAKGALSDKKVPEARMKDKKSQEGNKFTGNLMKARAAGKKSADLDGDGDMEKVKEDLKLSGAARAARSAVAQDLAGATAPGAAKENMMGALGKAAGAAGAAVAGAPQKTGIPATAKTTVPGLRATQQDLKQANASAALGEKTKNKKSSENIGAGLKHIAKGAAGAVAGHAVGKAINPALAPAGAAIGSKLATR
jgi:hypothetical protein